MIDAVRNWAERRDDIRALALIGSHARGDARPDSDIDFVLLCSDPSHYLRQTDWVAALGAVEHTSREDWGKVQSVRVRYRNGTEIEFGIAPLDWAAIPPDPGTSEVLRNGCRVLLDRDSLLGRVMRVIRAAGAGEDGVLSITIFEPEHVAAALSLWNATKHIGLSSADEPEALASFLERNPGLSFIALDSGRIVGTVLCGHDGRRGYVHHLAVAADHRRGGLGRTLLDASLDALRAAGIRKCHAFVYHQNPYAERFWERLGWERRDELLMYSKGIPDEPPSGAEGAK